jgi:hypothetical protein
VKNKLDNILADMGHDKDEHLALNLAESEKEFTPTFALLHFGKYNE